jgi:hypothetical protein
MTWVLWLQCNKVVRLAAATAEGQAEENAAGEGYGRSLATTRKPR